MSNSIPLSSLESSPSAKFENIGDKYAGTIVSMVEKQQTYDGVAQFFPSGDPIMVWVITIKTDEGDEVALWAKGGNFKVAQGSGESMLNAIGTAVRAAGANSVDVGAKLAVAHTGLGEKAKPQFNAPKLYTAQYQPPSPEQQQVPVEDLFS